MDENRRDTTTPINFPSFSFSPDVFGSQRIIDWKCLGCGTRTIEQCLGCNRAFCTKRCSALGYEHHKSCITIHTTHTSERSPKTSYDNLRAYEQPGQYRTNGRPQNFSANQSPNSHNKFAGSVSHLSEAMRHLNVDNRSGYQNNGKTNRQQQFHETNNVNERYRSGDEKRPQNGNTNRQQQFYETNNVNERYRSGDEKRPQYRSNRGWNSNGSESNYPPSTYRKQS